MNINDIKEPEAQIAEYSRTVAALADLHARLDGVVYDVTTTPGLAAAKRDRATLRDLRTGLKRERVRIKAPALERCRLIDEEAKAITAELAALEKPIDEQIKVEERRKEEERQAKINAEFGRVQAIQEAIHDLHLEAGVTGKPSSLIAERLADMRARVLSGAVFQEMLPQAEMARMQVLDKLSTALDAAKFSEAEAARLAAERQELAELRAAQAAQKAKDEAAAAELRKAQQAKHDAEMATKRAEQARLDAESAEARRVADVAAAEARAAAQAAHEAEMQKQAQAATEARRLAEEAAAKELAKKRKAEASAKKLTDAAPIMLRALKNVRQIIGSHPVAAQIIDEAIAAAE